MTDTAPPLPVILREARPEDLAYVYTTWSKSLHHSREGDPWASHVPWDEYREQVRSRIAQRLVRATLRVAVFDEDNDLIVGWACIGDGAVHYVYVRTGWRRQGLARLLLADMLNKPCVYTAHTKGAPDAPDGWRYRP